MAGFLEGISRFNEALDNNPDFQAARLQSMGADPLKVEEAIQPLIAKRQNANTQAQVNAILEQSGGNPSQVDILKMFSLNPDYTKMILEMNQRPAPSSTAGKIQADIDAGLIPADVGAAALKKATMPATQYMMTPDGEVVAIQPQTGEMFNLSGGSTEQPAAAPSAMGGLITPPPTGLSPVAKKAWTDKQITSAAETIESLKSTSSKLPQLVETVNKLSELGEKATYSELGKVIDWGAKQAGISTEGSVARTEYGSIVDNQVLPILKDTFGAQFTKAEGDALRATLGDKDTTPEQKNAVLSSFIRQKINDISALGSKAGIDVTPILKAAEGLRIGQPAKAVGGWSVEVVQ